MRRHGLALLLVAAVAGLGGCRATYTSIRQVDEKHWVITKVKEGFFSTSGHVLYCTPRGELNMDCVELDEPLPAP